MTSGWPDTGEVVTGGPSRRLADDPDGPTFDRSFALRLLLERPGCGDDDRAAVTEALAWLELHADGPSARFVLSPVLSRCHRLPPEQADQAFRVGRAWLRAFGHSAGAWMVLEPLLRHHREAVSDPAVSDLDVRDIAVRWLDRHAALTAAHQVITALLADSAAGDLAVGDRAVEPALIWLDEHLAAPPARSLLRTVLGGRLTPAQATSALNLAVRWLDKYGPTAKGSLVIRPALARAELTDPLADAVVQHALSWLEVFGRTPAARFLIRLVLVQPLGPERRAAAVRRALAWLELHRHTAGARIVLQPLLECGLPPPVGRLIEEYSLAWLDRQPVLPDSNLLIDSLRGRPLTPDRAARAAAHLARWSSHHATGAPPAPVDLLAPPSSPTTVD